MGNWTALRPAKDLYLKNNARIDAYQAELTEIAKGEPKARTTFWAYAGLMEITSRSNANAEAKASSNDLIDADWADTARRVILINAAVDLKNRNYDEQIIQATTDNDNAVRAAAARALRHFKIDPNEVDATPKVSTLSVEEALALVNSTKGVAAHGEAIFNKAACNSCHTVSEDEPQKGPYLGNIAAIYPRNELAEAILNPGKSIAQGFATYLITLKDGNAVMGFIHLRDHRPVNHAGYGQSGTPARQGRHYRAYQNAQLDDARRFDAQFLGQRICLPARLHCGSLFG